MVRQKQRSRGGSNFQAKKKVFEVDNGNGSDFEEEMPIQKTPQNKTPKGNQSMSGRKVSFELPGKTPQKNITTPTGKGKTAVQEFKGMKRNKAVQEEEDDDDDDDEDDDFELDMDDDDMDDISMDDDDSDEDADDVDEEEQGLTQKQKKSNAKQQKKVVNQLKKTPVKGAENSKGPQTPKDKTPKDERDAKSLYVGKIPKNVTMDMVKDLSPDIMDVRMNPCKDGTSYAFIEFPSEDIAESNYKTLQGKKLQGQLINIGYVGKKRSGLSGNTENKMYSTKLHVSGIPLDASIADVAVHFPTSVEIVFNKSKSYRTAVINVGDEKSAINACNSKIEVKGETLTVKPFMFNGNNQRWKRSRKSGHQGQNPAKKMKF